MLAALDREQDRYLLLNNSRQTKKKRRVYRFLFNDHVVPICLKCTEFYKVNIFTRKINFASLSFSFTFSLCPPSLSVSRTEYVTIRGPYFLSAMCE